MRKEQVEEIVRIRIEIDDRDLKPCPFCGAVPRVEQIGSDNDQQIRIACSNKKCDIQPATRWGKLFISDGRRAPNIQSNTAAHWNSRSGRQKRDYAKTSERSSAAKRFLAEIGG